jgi:hypothetical protein
MSTLDTTTEAFANTRPEAEDLPADHLATPQNAAPVVVD